MINSGPLQDGREEVGGTVRDVVVGQAEIALARTKEKATSTEQADMDSMDV